MKFCAAVVLTFVTATVASDNYDRSLHPSCPPPPFPPPAPRADGRVWVWVCPRPPRPSWSNDGHSSSSQDEKWEDDGHDDTWVGDAHAEADSSDDWHVESDENYDDIQTDDNDDHVVTDDNTWSDDGHTESDGGVTEDDGWNGDGYEEAPQDDGDEEVNDDTTDRFPPGEEDDGVEEVDSWDDDATADRHPAISESQLQEGQDARGEQGSNSIPVGAIAGAVAAAAAAAIIALAVARRRGGEEFVDVEDKDSIATAITPPPEARMAKDDDIEIDHTFFDENLFQQNYQEQELAYHDLYPEDDLSTINEDLGYTGDDVSI